MSARERAGEQTRKRQERERDGDTFIDELARARERRNEEAGTWKREIERENV